MREAVGEPHCSHLLAVRFGGNYKEPICPQWDSPRSMQRVRASSKTTHGENYGIMLRQECSHDGQWDLMEVPEAA